MIRPDSTTPQCGHWHRSCGRPWNKGAGSMSALCVSNATVYPASSAYRPSISGSSRDTAASALLVRGIDLPSFGGWLLPRGREIGPHDVRPARNVALLLL